MKKFVFALVVILAFVSLSFGATVNKSVTITAQTVTFYTATPVASVAWTEVTIDSISNTWVAASGAAAQGATATAKLMDGTTVIRIINIAGQPLPMTVNMRGVKVSNPIVNFNSPSISGTASALFTY